MKRKPMLNDKAVLDALLNNLDKEVAIVLDESNQMKIEDNKIEVWATIESLEDTYKIKPKIELTVVLYMLQFCSNNNLGIKINGIIDEFECIFDSNEIASAKSIVKASMSMVKYITDEITEEDLISKIKDIEVYFIGSFPDEHSDILELLTLDSEDSEKPLLPVFFTTYDIEKFNTDNMPISKAPLKDILYFFNIFSIALEPGKEYWVLLHN